MKKIIYSAAHAGYALDRVPLGGGATICTRLVEEWRRTGVPVETIGPDVLGTKAPIEKDLVRYSEREYADFCQRFERASTEAIGRYSPDEVAVLVNDISEGPSFAELGRRGYSLFTIFHVDVVDYISRLYLKGMLSPRSLTRFHRFLRGWKMDRLLPLIGRLIFEKQQEAVDASRALIVPSHEMKNVLERCYPGLPEGRVWVHPWGVWKPAISSEAVEQARLDFEREYSPSPSAFKIVTLSRISPEKGQDRLLRALKRWEGKATYPKEGVILTLCGEAAYMQGPSFDRHLHRLAGELQKTRVIFPGYVTGARKQALLSWADVYVFPSRHESYGLTLLEALEAGCPALACGHYGAHDLIQPEWGMRVDAVDDASVCEGLAEALPRFSSMRPEERRAMGVRGKTFAQSQSFEANAARLAQRLLASRPSQ